MQAIACEADEEKEARLCGKDMRERLVRTDSIDSKLSNKSNRTQLICCERMLSNRTN